jgi:glycosyltransferase involved in cell wall biosynthesis
MKLLGNEFLKSYKIKLLLIGSKDKAYMQEFNNKLESIKTCCSVVIDEAKPFNELRKYYSASDICIFPKQTSLSAIHAQVCGCPVVMERHVSNEERVFNKENLYEIDDLNQAAHIIKRIIERKEYYKTDENFIRFEEREYENQIRKLRSVVLELK